MDAGSNAVADSVRAANAEGVFYNLFANSVNANFNATILGAGPLPYTTPIIAPEDLPVLPFTPGRALTDGAADVAGREHGVPSPHTLAPGAYRDVRVNDGKTLNLGDGVYDFRSFSVGTNVTVNATGPDGAADRSRLVGQRRSAIRRRHAVGRARLRGGARLQPQRHAGLELRAPRRAAHAVLLADRLARHGRRQPALRSLLGATHQPATPATTSRARATGGDDPPPGGGVERRYQCYEIHRPTFNLAGVSVVDAVGASTVTHQARQAHLRPGRRRRTGSVGAARSGTPHLLHPPSDDAVRAREGDRDERASARRRVKLAKVDRLLVPTAKSLTAIPDPPRGADRPLQALPACRPRADRAEGLAVTDQFGSIQVALKKPLHLCLAAAVNGEPVPQPGASLMCYLVRGTRPAAPPPIIYTRNQFGPDQYPFFGPRDFCVPSTVVFE